MKKMNKKGFTLIELPTVIAILAVILLIAAPTILGVLDKAKKNTFKNQVMLYVSGIKTQVALQATGNNDLTITWTDDTTATLTIDDLNTNLMDADGLTGGSIVLSRASSLDTKITSYELKGVKNDEYCINATLTSSDSSFDIDTIIAADSADCK